MEKRQMQKKTQSQNRRSKKNKRKEKIKNNIGTLAVSFVVFALAAVIAYTGSGLKDKRDSYKQKEAILQKQIEAEIERSSELEEYEKYVQTKKYIEEVAKEKLGLVYDDEIIFKPEK